MIQLIQYNETDFKNHQVAQVENLFSLLLPDYVNWLNIEPTNLEEVEAIAKHFDIHHLIIEDIINTRQLPKFEAFDTYYFLNLKMLEIASKNSDILTEHISFILGSNYVITFQEREGDVFNEVRHRIEANLGRIRKQKADYLLYRLVDSVVDEYIRIVEFLRDAIEDLEEKVLAEPSGSIIREITELKSEINVFRKYVVPLRDEVGKMRNEPGKFISKSTLHYFRDVYDHLYYLHASFDTFREMLKDLLDLHLSQLSYEMNQIMKTLTVISAIFIPLTFLAGVYGMNFEYMPELQIRWAYPVLLVSMLLFAGGSIVYVKYKKWL